MFSLETLFCARECEVINLSLGTTTKILPKDLRSTDVDSEDAYLIYAVTRDPRIGAIYLKVKGRQLPVTSRGPVKTFTQADIDNGNISFNLFMLKWIDVT